MKENNPKEVDLLQLISIVFQWMKRIVFEIVKWCGSILQLTYKYKWIVIITLILFVACGQYFARPSARVYKAEAMAMIQGSDAQTLREICKQLENAMSTNKQLSLAAKISIPDSVSNNIVSVKTYNVIDYLKNGTADQIDFKNTHSPEDTLNLIMNDRVYIQVKVRKTSQVPVIQAAIMNFFNQNPVLKEKHEVNKRNLLERIKICDIELQRIDSLAKVFYFKENNDQMKFENNKLFVGENKKQLFYDEMLNINQMKGVAQSRLADYVRPVNFPSDFVVNPIPENGRIKYGILSLFYGLLISVILVLVIDNAKKVIKFLQNK